MTSRFPLARSALHHHKAALAAVRDPYPKVGLHCVPHHEALSRGRGLHRF